MVKQDSRTSRLILEFDWIYSGFSIRAYRFITLSREFNLAIALGPFPRTSPQPPNESPPNTGGRSIAMGLEARALAP